MPPVHCLTGVRNAVTMRLILSSVRPSFVMSAAASPQGEFPGLQQLFRQCISLPILSFICMISWNVSLAFKVGSYCTYTSDARGLAPAVKPLCPAMGDTLILTSFVTTLFPHGT